MAELFKDAGSRSMNFVQTMCVFGVRVTRVKCPPTLRIAKHHNHVPTSSSVIGRHLFHNGWTRLGEQVDFRQDVKHVKMDGQGRISLSAGLTL